MSKDYNGVDVLGESPYEEIQENPEVLSLLNYFSFTLKDFDKNHTHWIETFQGLAGDTEVTWARLVYDNKTKTIGVASQLWATFIEGWSVEAVDGNHPFYQWGLQASEIEDLKKRNLYTNVGFPGFVHKDRYGRAFFVPIEWPAPTADNLLDRLSSHQFDKYTNGTFQLFHAQMENMRKEFTEILNEAHHKADKLKLFLNNKKDHDLILSFKGDPTYTRLIVGLTKVYPLLPESGTLEVGDESIDLDKWAVGDEVNQICFKNIREILNTETRVRRLFMKYSNLIIDDEYFKGCFIAEVKKLLIASSSFIKTIYKFDGVQNNNLVVEKVKEITTELDKLEGDVGLDINEWVVYRYFDDGRSPVKVTDEAVNFKETLLERYLPSFVEMIYHHFLYFSKHPRVKPYVHKEIVEIDDGIKEGEIRQV